MNDFKWRHFAGEMILGAVRWYCRYGISYRELEKNARKILVHRQVKYFNISMLHMPGADSKSIDIAPLLRLAMDAERFCTVYL